MKVVDSRMAAHIRSEVTTVCTCWKLVRRDGKTYTWTDHDDDVLFQGETYASASAGGFDRAALESGASLDVSNTEMVGFLGTGLTRYDLDAGLFDRAALTVSLVNWADTTMGAIELRAGTLGEVTAASDEQYRVELRGRQQAYKQVIGESYSPEDRAIFGDARNGLLLSDYTAIATITTVTDRKTFTAQITTPMLKAPPAGMMAYGVVHFASGENAGVTVETKTYSETVTPGVDENNNPINIVTASVTLKFAVPNLLFEGDTVELIAGSDSKRETAIAYGNIVNFRGEPDVPGEKAIFKIMGPR